MFILKAIYSQGRPHNGIQNKHLHCEISHTSISWICRVRKMPSHFQTNENEMTLRSWPRYSSHLSSLNFATLLAWSKTILASLELWLSCSLSTKITNTALGELKKWILITPFIDLTDTNYPEQKVIWNNSELLFKILRIPITTVNMTYYVNVCF